MNPKMKKMYCWLMGNSHIMTSNQANKQEFYSHIRKYGLNSTLRDIEHVHEDRRQIDQPLVIKIQLIILQENKLRFLAHERSQSKIGQIIKLKKKQTFTERRQSQKISNEALKDWYFGRQLSKQNTLLTINHNHHKSSNYLNFNSPKLTLKERQKQMSQQHFLPPIRSKLIQNKSNNTSNLFQLTAIKNEDQESNMSTQRSIAKKLESSDQRLLLNNSKIRQNSFQKQFYDTTQEKQSITDILKQCKDIIYTSKKQTRQLQRYESEYQLFDTKITQDQNTIRQFNLEMQTL
eukprot:403343850